MSWIEQQMKKGINPRSVITEILGVCHEIPDGIPDFLLWQIIANILSESPKRNRLTNFNTLDDIINLVKVCKKIIVLTGAGVSVSCGIPDFRSQDGIYARLSVDFPGLPDPQAMFDINYFRKDPRPFFRFAKELFPGQFSPSLCHRFIHLLEDDGKLLRNYTQNIDALEQVAGIKNVVQCHGSFATATCQRCLMKLSAEAIKEDVFKQTIPKCDPCLQSLQQVTDQNREDGVTSDVVEDKSGCNIDPCNSQQIEMKNEEFSGIESTPATLEPIIKPDIVFFGESLPEEFYEKLADDKNECDLLIVIGSSLKVKPVALIPSSIPENIPQILINKEPLSHMTFDVELLGDCDIILSELCSRMGEPWSSLCIREPLREILELPVSDEDKQENENESEEINTDMKRSLGEMLPEGSYYFDGGHHYIFPGAEVYDANFDDSTDSDLQNQDSRSNSDSMESAGSSHSSMESAGSSHSSMESEGSSHSSMESEGSSHSSMDNAGSSHSSMDNAGSSHSSMDNAGTTTTDIDGPSTLGNEHLHDSSEGSH